MDAKIEEDDDDDEMEVSKLEASKKTVGSSSQPSVSSKRPRPKGPMDAFFMPPKVTVQR